MLMPAPRKLSKYALRPTSEIPFKVGAYHTHGFPVAGFGAAYRNALCSLTTKVSADFGRLPSPDAPSGNSSRPIARIMVDLLGEPGWFPAHGKPIRKSRMAAVVRSACSSIGI